jgi:uncharacterized protein YukE
VTTPNNGLNAETSELLASRAKAQSLADGLTSLQQRLASEMDSLYTVSAGSAVPVLRQAHEKFHNAVTGVVQAHTEVHEQTTKAAQHYDQVDSDSRSRYAGL